eukprot:gene11013-11167_t
MAILPEGLLLRHVATPSDLADILSSQLKLDISPAIIQATHLRLAGNMCAVDGDLQGAVAKYQQALQLSPSKGAYKLHSNLSATFLQLGDKQKALQHAQQAVATAPKNFHMGFIRLIDALYALGCFREASDALQQAVQQDAIFKTLPEYKGAMILVLQGQIERNSYTRSFMSQPSSVTVAGAADANPAKDLLGAAQAVQQLTSAAASQAAAGAQATQQAAVKLAQDAVAGVDTLVSDLSSSAADFKLQAAGSSKAAGAAMDKMVAAAIAKGQALKEALAAGQPEVAAQVDAVLGKFVSKANELRTQLNSQQLGASKALDETAAALAVFGSEIKDLVFAAYSIKFPSALAGMFGVFVLLCLVGDSTANKVLALYQPALNWIARWLPLFYVPALVTLPLALNGIPGADLLRIVGILSVGMVATLMFTAQITVFIREAVKTPVKEIAKAKPSPPFLPSHYISWGVIAVASLAATVFGGPELGAQMALPFGLAATIGGYLIGELVPKAYHGVLHPVLVTAVLANAGCALQGSLLGWSYTKAQQMYLAKGAGPMGAGDALMGLLGIVIISFGFRIYTQRDTMKRHFPEIFGATILSSVFSLFSTAFAAKALGLSSALARALVPRSVTVALALPIAQGLEAPLAITAAAVLLQGILGANFGPNLMTAFGVKDTIARGLAAAGTAGGLGTASLTSKEPEALPFCALSYALVGIFSTVIMSVPAVRDVVISIVG